MPTHIHTNRCRATLLRVIGDSPAIAQVLNRTHNGSHDCPLCDTVGYKDPTTRSMVFPALIGNPRTTKDAITKGREMDTELASKTPEAMLHMAQQKNPTRPSSCGYLGSCPLTDVPGFEVHRDVNVDMMHAEKKLMDMQISLAKGTRAPVPPKAQVRRKRTGQSFTETEDELVARRQKAQDKLDAGPRKREWRALVASLEEWRTPDIDDRLVSAENNLGASLRRPPGLLATPSHPFSRTDLFLGKTHNCHVMLMTLYEYVFAPLFPSEKFTVSLAMIQCMRKMIEFDGTNTQLEELDEEVPAAVNAFLQAVPLTEHSTKLHQLVHYPSQLREWGFIRWSWCYPLERMMGVLKRMAKSTRFPLASISRTYQRTLSSSYASSNIHQDSEIGRSWHRVYTSRSHRMPKTGATLASMGLMHLAMSEKYQTRPQSGWTVHGRGLSSPSGTLHHFATLHNPRLRTKLGTERQTNAGSCDYIVIRITPDGKTEIAALRGFRLTSENSLSVEARLIPHKFQRGHLYIVDATLLEPPSGRCETVTILPAEIGAQALVADHADSHWKFVIMIRR